MRDKLLIERIVKGLWEAYSAEIRSGLPVYFCFHKQQIQQVMRDAGINSPNSYDQFLEVSRSFLKIGRDISEIKYSVYDPIWNGFSSAIILIAAQVVAVEMMDKDEFGSRSDAYYLSLRKLISDEMNLISRLPFVESEYLTLWDYFKREIQLYGGSNSTITFSEGNSRKDKNRNFPISQSLLSQAELVSVCSLIYSSSNSIPRLQEIPNILYKVRTDLPNRVRSKIDRASQKVKIIEQIHAFYRKYGVVEAIEQNSSRAGATISNGISIRGFLEGLVEEVCIFEAWDVQIGKVDFQSEVVIQFFESKPIVILGRTSRNDFYWNSDVTGELRDFEDFLVVYTKSKAAVFEYFLEKNFKGAKVGVPTRCELSDLVVLQFEKSMIRENCLIRKGVPISGVVQTSELTILGGIHLDYTNYLAEFGIDGFSVNGRRVACDEIVVLDETEMTSDQAIAMINQKREGGEFQLQVQGIRRILRLVASGTQRDKARVKYGHVIKDGLMEPNKSILEPHNSFYSGFEFVNNEVVIALTRQSNYIALINKSNFVSGVKLTAPEMEKIYFAISRLAVPEHIKKIMERNIAITGKVPSQIFSFL